MNIIKQRRKRGAVCSVCRSPDYEMTPPIEGETTKPSFRCGSCGHSWMFGKSGGKYAELGEDREKTKKTSLKLLMICFSR